MYRKLTAEEKEIISEFEIWVSKMEKKHSTVSANIYTSVMRYLNRMDRQIRETLKAIETEPVKPLPEKYKHIDWSKLKK